MSSSSYTELGFQISGFRFAIRLPKLRLRRPKRKSTSSSGSSGSSGSSPISSIKTEHWRHHRRSAPDFNSEQWIKEFNARVAANPRTCVAQLQDVEEEEDPFYVNLPSATSTPVSYRVLPLHKLEKQRVRFLPDLSGVQIYETCEVGEMFPSLATSSNTATARAHFRPAHTRPTSDFKPRNLKSSSSYNSLSS